MHIDEDEDEGGEDGSSTAGSSHGPRSGMPRAPEPKTLDQLDEDEEDLEPATFSISRMLPSMTAITFQTGATA